MINKSKLIMQQTIVTSSYVAYRKQSSSQTSEVAILQMRSNEIWGGPSRNFFEWRIA